MLNYYRAFARRPQKSLASIVKIPTLILHGLNDGAVHYRLAELSASYCHLCEFVVIPHARHWIHREEPKLINRRLLEFLGRHI